MMTIDQNEQTAARKEGGREAASELSGVTDSPLPLLRSTYLVRRQKPKASCPRSPLPEPSPPPPQAAAAAISLAQWPTTDCGAKKAWATNPRQLEQIGAEPV